MAITSGNPADKPVLLVVDDDPLITDPLVFLLGDDFTVRVAATRSDARRQLIVDGWPPALALIDLGLPPTPHQPDEGFALIGEVLAACPQTRIVVLSGQSDEAHARHARTLGALDFVAKPIEGERLRALLRGLLACPGEEKDDQAQLPIGDSLPMQKLRQQIEQYASAPWPVLIEGESGSGKEIAARLLHQRSPRAAHPFVAVNCAAIAPTLVEAMLFGHARGAFTGASGARAGYFEDAGEGTLLLDEIGELPLELQPKLLRVLENGEFHRIGETQTRYARARIVAATNRDLRREVRAGRFRADLYHRLSVFTVQVPPLREMGGDSLLLLDHFRHHLARHGELEPFRLDAQAEALWRRYSFPGNVRELRNIVIRLATRYPGQTVGPGELAGELDEEFDQELGTAPSARNPRLDAEQRLAIATAHLTQAPVRLDVLLRDWEAAYIEAAQRLSQGNLSQAARLLGLPRTTLYNRLEVLAREERRNAQERPSRGFLNIGGRSGRSEVFEGDS